METHLIILFVLLTNNWNKSVIDYENKWNNLSTQDRDKVIKYHIYNYLKDDSWIH